MNSWFTSPPISPDCASNRAEREPAPRETRVYASYIFW
jgi:hypothetical protein